jgi:hypothetical protein
MLGRFGKWTVAAMIGGTVLAAALPAVAAEIIVQTAPPPLRVEVVPALPGPAAKWFWRPGHWRWNGARYVWVRGHYIHRIRPGAVWVAGHWADRPGGFVWVRGRWK